MANKTIRTIATRTAFLSALAEGGNVRDACRRLGINRQSLYPWKANDPAFASDWDRALVLGAEALEDEARRRAKNGSDILLMFLLRALKPEKFRDRIVVKSSNYSASNLELPMSKILARLEELRRAQGGSQVG